MPDDYPNDADGDVLRRIANDGSNMAKPMLIDFQVAMPDEASARELAGIALELGYRVDAYESPECSLPWTTECSTRMLATYAGVIAVQAELAELSRRYGGYPDGWGSFGNGPSIGPADRSSANS